MKLSFLAGAAAGYVLGARAGRARYEQIMRAYRTITASPTVQSGAGALQSQGEELIGRVRSQVGARLPGGHTSVR